MTHQFGLHAAETTIDHRQQPVNGHSQRTSLRWRSLLGDQSPVVHGADGKSYMVSSVSLSHEGDGFKLYLTGFPVTEKNHRQRSHDRGLPVTIATDHPWDSLREIVAACRAEDAKAVVFEPVVLPQPISRTFGKTKIDDRYFVLGPS